MKYRLAGVLAASMTLAACITTGDDGSRNDGSPSEAAQINYELGSQYLRQGRLKLARERLERAVEQDPRLPGPHMALALIHERRGDTDRADSAYRQALKVAPDNANVQNTYAVFLCNRGRHADGQEYFSKAAQNDENRAPEVAFSNAGVCALAVPDLVAAEVHFRNALKRNPEFSDALLQMASVSFQRGKFLPARAFLERYESSHKMTAEALLLAVQIEKSNGNRRSTKTYAELLRTRFPESDETRQLNGILNDG